METKKKKTIHFSNRKECIDVIKEIEGGSQKIGEIFENTFVTKRSPEKHIMRRWKAYGFTSELIDSEMFDIIVVVEEPSGRTLMITLEDVMRVSRVEMVEEEEQHFIPVSEFTVIK